MDILKDNRPKIIWLMNKIVQVINLIVKWKSKKKLKFSKDKKIKFHKLKLMKLYFSYLKIWNNNNKNYKIEKERQDGDKDK